MIRTNDAETISTQPPTRLALPGESLRINFNTSDLLYWQAVVAVIVTQFGLCYDAMTCRGHPPLTEIEIYKMLSSPLLVWVPAIFGSRVNRMRGIMVMSIALTVFLSMVHVNGGIRPSVGSHSGPVGIINTYFVDILFLTAFYAPIGFFVLYFFERVTGDIWRMICFRYTEKLSFSETWTRVWEQPQNPNAD